MVEATSFLRLTLLAVLSWQATAHRFQRTSAMGPPTNEELSTSLIFNQLAIMQLMHDTSNTSCAAKEMQRERDADEEAQRLERALQETREVLATLEAQQRQTQQVLDTLNITSTNTLTKVEELREEMKEELGKIVQDDQMSATQTTLQPETKPIPDFTYLGPIVHNDSLPSLCSGDKFLLGTVGALELTNTGTYSDNVRCSWNLKFPHGSWVDLTWEYFDLEPCCGCDWVEVRDVTHSSNLVYGRKLCGKGISSSILSLLNVRLEDTQNLLVSFRSDGSRDGRGFRLLYYSHN